MNLSHIHLCVVSVCVLSTKSLIEQDNERSARFHFLLCGKTI
jgi:hypothetical protein